VGQLIVLALVRTASGWVYRHERRGRGVVNRQPRRGRNQSEHQLVDVVLQLGTPRLLPQSLPRGLPLLGIDPSAGSLRGTRNAQQAASTCWAALPAGPTAGEHLPIPDRQVLKRRAGGRRQ
jgi:hypothetical protein